MKDNLSVKEVACEFCHKKTEHKPLLINDVVYWDIYFCEPCLAEYVTSGMGSPALNLYTWVNKRLYKWAYRSSVFPSATLYWVSEPGTPGLAPNRKVVKVIAFVSPPEITPSNIKDKVKLILTFL